MLKSLILSYLTYRPEVDIEEHEDLCQVNSFGGLLVLFRFDVLSEDGRVSQVTVPVVNAILN